jgi:uncharacterized membrane protein
MTDIGSPTVPAQLGPRAAALADRVNAVVVWVARHWLASVLAYAVVLTTLPAVAPLLASFGADLPARAIYFAYQFVCHQRADRSFSIAGEQMAFCQRDLAIFAGAIATAALYGAVRRLRVVEPPRLRWVALLMLPMALDGTSQLVGIRESTWELRLLTGVLFSIGAGLFVLPHLESGFASIVSASAEAPRR